jgi:DNA-binding GntR family transcriptional regulator
MTKLMKVIRAQPLREQVVNGIVEGLRTGLFKSGERLTEVGVALALGVSRTPVREALNALAQQGVLARRSGGGYVVPSHGRKAIEDVFECRRLLEPYAARRLAEIITEEGAVQLRDALQDLRRSAATGSAEETMEANLQMRRRLFGLLDNEPLARAIAQFSESVQLIGVLTLADMRMRKLVVSKHEHIVRALLARDPAKAEQAMLAYIEGAREAALAALQRNQSTPV